MSISTSLKLAGLRLAVCSALAFAATGLATANAEPSFASTQVPSWWNGTTCDTYHYPGSHALGASYDGVQACGPGPTQGGADHLISFGEGTSQYEWECVELSMRYMYLVYGITPYYLPNGAQDIVSAYRGSLLKKVSNGSGSVPSPGDILAFAASASHPVFGHTAIVTSVSIDGNGNGTVTFMQENASSSGWGSVSVTSHLLGDSITGWLHYPSSQPPPPPSPSITSSQQGTTVQGDFNGDGDTDIAVFYYYADARTVIWVYWGNGTGSFSAPTVAWDSGPNAWDATNVKPVVGDFNGDGKADIAAFYNYGSATTALFVFTSQGTTFGNPAAVWGSGNGNWDWNAMQAVSGDFNGDGKTDIAVMYSYPGALTVLDLFSGNGSGAFATPVAWWNSGAGNWAGSLTKLSAGDVNHDGKTDIIAMYDYGNSNTSVFVFLSQGTSFSGPQGQWNSGAGNWTWSQSKLISGDFNGDGRADLAVFQGDPQSRYPRSTQGWSEVA